MSISDLINVPSFVITQTDSEGNIEQPIWVQFYNGTVSLEQDGQSINILPEIIPELFKAIKKHTPEAEKLLDWRK